MRLLLQVVTMLLLVASVLVLFVEAARYHRAMRDREATQAEVRRAVEAVEGGDRRNGGDS